MQTGTAETVGPERLYALFIASDWSSSEVAAMPPDKLETLITRARKRDRTLAALPGSDAEIVATIQAHAGRLMASGRGREEVALESLAEQRKQTKYLRAINSVMQFILLLIIITLVLQACAAIGAM